MRILSEGCGLRCWFGEVEVGLVERVGASATVAIMEEAVRRGIGEEEVEVEVKGGGLLGGGY